MKIEWERDETTIVRHECITPIGTFVITEPYEWHHLYEVKHNNLDIAGLETLEECFMFVGGYIKNMALFLNGAKNPLTKIESVPLVR